MAPALTREDVDGVARLLFNLPGEPLNKITRGVRDELESTFNQLQADPSVRAVILVSGKPDTFIAGADIEEFVALRTQAEAERLVRTGQALINRLSTLGKPVLAAIHGACVGGGLEAVLACAYRIATDHPKTILGLPEVQIGIIPAAGGCQRLPRLIGLRAALDIILAGKTVPAARAYRLGLVDELVHPAILDDAAMKAARRLASGWRPDRSPRGGLTGWLLEGNPAGRALVLAGARRAVRQKTGGHYPAPFVAIEAIGTGLSQGMAAGFDREARAFAELAVSDVSRKLVQIFFATTALKKDSGVPDPSVRPRPVAALAVVGAGFMGAAIGGVAVAQAEIDVRLRDADHDRVGKGLNAARRILKDRLDRRRITRFEYRRLSAFLSGGTDGAGLRRADLVIEAVFEDLKVKHEVFREMEARTSGECILASNTSTIPIARIAEAVKRPERVIGMHFFSPVEKMPLLEVIVTDSVAPQVVVTAVDFGRRMGKTVIVVRDRPGFWVNRILGPYLNEAGHLVVEGVPVTRIDGAMTRFGFPVGPITVLDEVGLDVAAKAARVLREAFGDRMKAVELVDRMLADNRLGRKNGKGFYLYQDGRRRGVDPAVQSMIGAKPDPGIAAADIEARLVFMMLNEAARALDEGVVRSPRDGDVGALFGIGFPPFRGGPLRYIDDLGASEVVATLERLARTYGNRFEPAASLVRMASVGSRFYS